MEESQEEETPRQVGVHRKKKGLAQKGNDPEGASPRRATHKNRNMHRTTEKIVHLQVGGIQVWQGGATERCMARKGGGCRVGHAY